MIIQSSPLEFTQTETMEASILMNTRMSEMLKLSSRIIPITIQEQNILTAKEIRTYTLPTGGGVLVSENFFYCPFTTQTNKILLLCSCYIISVNGNQNDINSFATIYQKYLSNVFDIIRHTTSYEAKMMEFSIFASKMVGYKPFDINALIKAGKKYKIEVARAGEDISFIVRNVRCGNEIEGYLQYKAIQMFMTEKYTFRHTIYYFNKFMYDTRWGISRVGSLHPHIGSGGSICWGNRVSDVQLYIESRSYAFLLEVLKESLFSYNPGDGDDGAPFRPVKEISEVIRLLNKLIDIKLSKDGNSSSKEINSSRYFAETIGNSFCPHCDYITNEEGRCVNLRCKGCEKANIKCSKCQQDCVIGDYDEDARMFEWICNNEQCMASPKYPYRVTAPYCRHCGRPSLTRSGYPCVDKSCRGYTLSQWRTYEQFYCAFDLINSPWISPEEAAKKWEAGKIEQDKKLKALLIKSAAIELIPGVCPSCGNKELSKTSDNDLYCTARGCKINNTRLFNNAGEYIYKCICDVCGNYLKFDVATKVFTCTSSSCVNYNIPQCNAVGDSLII